MNLPVELYERIMAVNVRRSNKKVTDPLNDKVRAMIISYTNSTDQSDLVSSSTSSSSPSPSPSPSPCLSYLVQSFLEDDCTSIHHPDSPTRPCPSDSDSDDFIRRSDPMALIEAVINPTVWNNTDPFRNQLLSHLARAVEIFSVFKSNKPIFNGNLMAYLRELGYNAGVCKTHRDSTAGGGLTSGSYEFIDVIRPADLQPVRYIIDADFAGEFEIARETESFRKLQSSLPRVFVGKSENLKRIVRLMCDEAKRSMKINGLTLPPWRKNRYMQAKWFGPYSRTTNHSTAPANSSPSFTVKCRAVGFELAGDGSRLFVPPATRTR